MARAANHRSRHAPRPALALNPSPLSTLGAVVVGGLMLSLAWIAVRNDGGYGLVWALPGAYVFFQPLRGIVRGLDQQLRIVARRIDLSNLARVAVFERNQWGFNHGVAVLKFPDHVEHVSGLFLSTKSFTRLVQWLAVPIEVVPGAWSSRRLASERPDLLATPAKPAPKK